MNKENLANAILATPLSDSDTTMVLEPGYGAGMPANPPYHITLTPFAQLSTRGTSEIVKCTARSGDSLTIVRGQRGTTAKNFDAGDVVSNGVYVEDIDAKLDRSGGTISGGLEIEGDLTASDGQDIDFSGANEVKLPNGTIFKGSAIIDSGSNWVRFGDGTQICWIYEETGSAAMSLHGSNYYKDATMGDWQKPFISPPYTTSSCSNQWVWTNSFGGSATSAGTVRTWRGVSVTTNFGVYVIGVGRWK